MELFRKYHCKAYMKKASDFAHIQVGYGAPDVNINDAKSIVGIYQDKDGETVEKDLSECCGEGIPKRYYDRVEKEFDGFLVGTKTLNCKEIIGTDTSENDYRGEYRHFFKEITYAPMVGVVYFRNNGKRYVLLEDMELAE